MAPVPKRAPAVEAVEKDPNAGLHDPKDDICPVCKSSRYFNPTMELLVSPECWHRMCASCVGRIFAHGPAQCPIAGCKKTLRKHRFRQQTFEDIRVEREVDVRREVADVMNRREEDFETVAAYNDYLEQCETMTFNLTNGIDVAATRKALDAYRAQNASAIKSNAARERDEREEAVARAAADREAAKLRRRAAAREADEERADRAAANRDIVDALSRGDGDATSIARRGAASLTERLASKRADIAAPAPPGSNGDASSFAIRGLRTKPLAGAAVAKPYSPFAGVHYRRRYATPRDRYAMAWLDAAREDPRVAAGGYDVGAYCNRALVDAFAGLGVFVADEVAMRDAPAEAVAAVGAEAKAADDVF